MGDTWHPLARCIEFGTTHRPEGNHRRGMARSELEKVRRRGLDAPWKNDPTLVQARVMPNPPLAMLETALPVQEGAGRAADSPRRRGDQRDLAAVLERLLAGQDQLHRVAREIFPIRIRMS